MPKNIENPNNANHPDTSNNPSDHIKQKLGDGPAATAVANIGELMKLDHIQVEHVGAPGSGGQKPDRVLGK